MKIHVCVYFDALKSLFSCAAWARSGRSGERSAGAVRGDCPAQQVLPSPPLPHFPFLSSAVRDMIDRMKKTIEALRHVTETMSNLLEDLHKEACKCNNRPHETWLQPVRQWLDQQTASGGVGPAAGLISRYEQELDLVIKRQKTSPSPAAGTCQLTGQHKVSIVRRAQSKFGPELQILRECADCVLNYYQSNDADDFFTRPCPDPHVAVWVKMKGYPYWWPAKVIAIHSERKVATVWFFGPKGKTAEVGFACIRFLTSDLQTGTHAGNPSSPAEIKKLDRNDSYLRSIDSLRKYIDRQRRTPAGHRLQIVWPPSAQKFDRRTVTFPMMMSESSDSDSEYDSFADMLFSARETITVPNQYLETLMQDKRWLRVMLIEPADLSALTDVPSGVSTSALPAVPRHEREEEDEEETDIDDMPLDSSHDSDLTEIEAEADETPVSHTQHEPDYELIVARLRAQFRAEGDKQLQEYRKQLADYKARGAQQIADVRKKLDEETLPLLRDAGRMQ